MNVLLLPAEAALATTTSRVQGELKLRLQDQMVPNDPQLTDGVVPPCWLAARLRAEEWSGLPYVLDFRRPQDFRRAHIQGSVNVVLPSLLYRRLQRGSVTASSVVIAVDEVRRRRTTPLILVDDSRPSSPPGCTPPPSPNDGNNNSNDLLIPNLVYKRLCEEGYPVAFLQGSLSGFLSQYPEFRVCTAPVDTKCSSEEALLTPVSRASPNASCCQTASCCCSCSSPSSLCLAKMKTLRLDQEIVDASARSTGEASPEGRRSARATCRPLTNSLCSSAMGLMVPVSSSCSSSTTTSSCCSSSVASRTSMFDYKVDTGHFPVEIIPNLYLGNASNAADMDILVKYNIKYIVNVTRNLPNAFEHDARLKYLQIPIDDNWSQNLAAHFPQAIDFIDEARTKKCGVLVHCLAGISRSVTVTVAYLMYTLSLTLDEAYDLVKQHKPNISPNFDFLGQLVEFERVITAGRGGPTVTSQEVNPADSSSSSSVEDCQIGAYHHSALAVGTSS